MTQFTSNRSSQSFAPVPTRRDSPVRWALNAFRLNKDAGSAIAIQEREGSIYVCVRKGEVTNWVLFQKVMTLFQLETWIRDGGFPRDSSNPNQR